MFIKRIALPLIAIVIFSALFGGCAKTKPFADTQNTADNAVNASPLSDAVPVYSKREVDLPNGCNLITQLCAYGDNIYFIAHFESESSVYTMKTDGSALKRLPSYVPLENTRVIALAADSGGALWVAENNTYAAPLSGQKNIYIIRKLNAEGAELARLDISDTTAYHPEGNVGFDRIETDADGNVYLYDMFTIRVFDNAGKQIFLYEYDGNFTVTNLLKMSDASVSAVGLDLSAVRNGSYDLRISKIDIETAQLTPFAKTSENPKYVVPGGNGFDFYYANQVGAGAFRLPGVQQKLIDWSTYGISNNVSSFTAF
ncbi:MAG: hypothetical protein LBN97_10115, partial [Oscillospiraceae bacterium]|nr:hypothetical protein [Oscillospiraceae bacterium]